MIGLPTVTIEVFKLCRITKVSFLLNFRGDFVNVNETFFLFNQCLQNSLFIWKFHQWLGQSFMIVAHSHSLVFTILTIEQSQMQLQQNITCTIFFQQFYTAK